MDLQRLFAYNTWANREVIASHPVSLDVLAHIIGAEQLWLGRIRVDPTHAVVWPKLTLAECAAAVDRLDAEWQRVLDAEDRGRKVEYTNSKGERWTNTVDDILTHVVLHGSYHRGQIATLVRQGGARPAYTDYIHCVRQGLI